MSMKIDKADYAMLYGVFGEQWPVIAPDYRLAREPFEFDDTVSDRPEGNPLTYRLSSQGGDVWAEYAGVDWSRVFVSWCGAEPNE